MKILIISLLFMVSDTYLVTGVKDEYGKVVRQTMKVREETSYGYSTLTVVACRTSYGWNKLYYGGSVIKTIGDISDDYEYQTNACGGTTYFNL